MSKKTKLMLGNNIESLKKLPDNSIDSIVSDPPYGISFMSKRWDYDVPSVEFWKEVYRVLKPGGHVLSFGGTRTYHRMVVNIEDAGFEIRDQIMWLYGSGFPKSHNIGKAVDKLQGNDREIVGIEKGAGSNKFTDGVNGLKPEYEETKGTSQYEGWGTALKPSNEPICVARKPLSEKSVAENVLKWGTGGINIDGCRVGTDDKIEGRVRTASDRGLLKGTAVGVNDYQQNSEGRFPANIILECLCDEVIKGEKGEVKRSGGRDRTKHDYNSVGNFGSKEGAILAPDNYNDKGDIHTNPMCPCYIMDAQSGISTTKCVAGVVDKTAGVFQSEEGKSASGHKKKVYPININDKGGASRFFYQAKVSKSERNMSGKCSHPTLKPIQLMSYLCKLVTPPGGIILDPFSGSGSTGIAALLNDFRFVGMELEQEYFDIMEKRVNDYESYRKFLKK